MPFSFVYFLFAILYFSILFRNSFNSDISVICPTLKCNIFLVLNTNDMIRARSPKDIKIMYNKAGIVHFKAIPVKEIPKQTPHQNSTEILQIPQSTNNIEYIDTKENTEIKEIEYSSRIYNMLEQGMSLEDVAKCLAPTDWNCFVYFKDMLRGNENTKEDYFKMNRVFSDLNYNFNPN